MRPGKMMMAVWILLALAVAFVIFFAVDRDGFWQRIAGNPDLGQTDFANLGPAPKPNEALACPDKSIVDFCPRREPDLQTGKYALDAAEMRVKLIEIFTSDKLVKRVDKDASPLKLRFVRRTAIMRYPDTFSVEIIALEDGSSTLAIHGKALVGTSDLGNNLKLVRKILDGLEPYKG